ncbi:hypothetical protein, partial [Mesorhizobium sp.]|uniref:hypothetical protein n=1 Tax=Mesorhizobium sp. TaxID=1871066 RepID=UPI0025E285BE
MPNLESSVTTKPDRRQRRKQGDRHFASGECHQLSNSALPTLKAIQPPANRKSWANASFPPLTSWTERMRYASFAASQQPFLNNLVHSAFAPPEIDDRAGAAA